MDKESRFLIGELLLSKGFITKEQLDNALVEQKRTNKRLGDILVEKGAIKEIDLVQVLSEQLGITYVDIDSYIIDRDVIDLVKESTARDFICLPLFLMNDTLTVAMADPLDIGKIDSLKRIVKYNLDPVFATETGIKKAIEKYYGKQNVFADHVGKESTGTPAQKTKSDQEKINELVQQSEDKPVVKMVNLLIEQAVKDEASDVHIEPMQDKLMVRMRIDGILHEVANPAKEFEAALISRIKIIAGMDIAEKRLPQDGRIQMSISGKTIDMRISTFPTIYGENVAIRILDKSKAILDLNKIGANEKVLKNFKELIQKPNGIVLVTGPTGSGKTTTLYAVLNLINSPTKNIIALEDPVEYVLEGIRQSQIDVKSGFTFANGLRSIVRQDPDIVMIGEIRDLETSEISIHASLTGHLVFSTLHTNDATSAITRLVDMGVEPYLVASSITGILAQRLVRVLCKKCRRKTAQGYEPEGCSECNNTGYKGRTGIFELMLMDEQIKDLILNKAAVNQLKAKAQSLGMQTLYEDGFLKVKNGITSLSEVMRVTQE
ncbi:MAG: ATPase, T2SS/T4P/T4SS family [Candidatus Gygaella obscura]|nr:ATPase, T2SS/T4P/T4SS family [Candidatus Gygaella obscura]